MRIPAALPKSHNLFPEQVVAETFLVWIADGYNEKCNVTVRGPPSLDWSLFLVKVHLVNCDFQGKLLNHQLVISLSCIQIWKKDLAISQRFIIQRRAESSMDQFALGLY